MCVRARRGRSAGGRLAALRRAVRRGPAGTAPVTVIICTRGRAHSIGRTLESLRAMDYPDLDVLVIDGSADDQTAAVCCASSFPTWAT